MLLGHIFATAARILAGTLATSIDKIMLVLLCAFVGVLVVGFVGWKYRKK